MTGVWRMLQRELNVQCGNDEYPTLLILDDVLSLLVGNVHRHTC